MATKREALTTVKQIRALQPEAKDYVHNIKGSRGLYVKVTPQGKKDWYYRYRVGPLFEWMKLGTFAEGRGGMTLADAKDEIEVQRQIVKKHGSAKQFRDAERAKNFEELQAGKTQAAQTAYTVAVMCRDYIEEASREIKSWAESDRALKKYVTPYIGEMPAHEVTRKDVIATLEPLNKDGKTVQANRTLAYLRRAYNWALGKDKFDIRNPCDRIEPHKEKSKDRALSDTEIRRLLTNMPQSSMTETEQDLLLFVLLTGLRPGEAAGASTDQVDADAATITLTDTKNGKTHVVPLNARALEIATRRKDESRWLFPMQSKPNRPTGGDRIQSPLRKALPTLKVMQFTPHDLRRTMATGLAKLQCPSLLISLALNHSVPGITSVYNRYSYADELREWYEKWGAHIESLTNEPEELRKVG